MPTPCTPTCLVRLRPDLPPLPTMRPAPPTVVRRLAVTRHVAAGLTAGLLGACGGGDSPVSPAPTSAVHFVGQAVAAGAASLAGLRFFARRDAAPAQDYGAALDASGAFRLDASLPGAATDSLTLAVDADAGVTRTVRPVVVRVTRGTAPTALRPLLVPRAVALPAAGSYAGTMLTVSLRDAFTPVCATVSDANCNSFFPRDWLTGVEVWPEASLPVPLAFNRPGSAGPIAAADSAALWSIVRQMERDLGRPLFRPATLADLAAPDSTGYSMGAVLVSIDPGLGVTRGYTNWIWSANRDVVASRTRLGSAAMFAAPSLVTHELLHALGFHHTCAWTTVMGGYGCGSSQGASVADAAGFALAYEVRAAQAIGAPTTGLAESRAGELRFELGVVADRGAADTPRAARAPAGAEDASSRPRVVRGVAVREAGAP